MEYTKIHTEPWEEEPDSWWIRILRRVIPAANPDLEEQFYPLTRTWWIELDDDRIAQREIGFNESGDAVVLGPVGNNHGFAVDDDQPWSEKYEHCEETASQFQKVWDSLWPRFSHLENCLSRQGTTPKS